MNKGSIFITFAIGAITGSVATYISLKKKYEQKLQEDTKKIQKALRDYYRSTNEVEKPSEEETYNMLAAYASYGMIDSASLKSTIDGILNPTTQNETENTNTTETTDTSASAQ